MFFEFFSALSKDDIDISYSAFLSLSIACARLVTMLFSVALALGYNKLI